MTDNADPQIVECRKCGRPALVTCDHCTDSPRERLAEICGTHGFEVAELLDHVLWFEDREREERAAGRGGVRSLTEDVDG